MELMQSGSEPATKEDLRNLEATMLAGFETCAYLLNCIMLAQADSGEGLNPHLAEVAASQTKENFKAMFEVAKTRILSEQ